MAWKSPQATYAGLQKSLQQEWIFMQWATQGLGEDFRPMEKALREDSLPSPLLRSEEHMPNQTIMGFMVKHEGIATPDLILTAQEK